MSKIKNKYNCALALTNNIFGGKWKMRILWHIIRGENRFSELKKVIPDITEKVLYTNLKELENDGIIYRKVYYDQKPTAVMYYLPDEYKRLEGLIESISEFTRDYARLNNIELE